ncbi:MAG: SIR2 family NAD-dependent protein deacylase [Atopobiaceae bacterium]|jgi:NAD-dependent SIR2 family protein deacetylase
MISTSRYSGEIEALKDALATADVLLVGAGAGLSFAAGMAYSRERFYRTFADFHQKYGIDDMYSGGFYPFASPEESWAWWSRAIWVNRYEPGALPLYQHLCELMRTMDSFVITTNVDHQFQLAGCDKDRLYYMQGDYGLLQCSVPCHQKTYDARPVVEEMVHEQRNMRVPSELIPHCPVCGKPMTMNLRVNDRFVQDTGWYVARKRYEAFLDRTRGSKIVLLELGVGFNTPGIIKYPFWRYAAENKNARYVSINKGEMYVPAEIKERSVCIDGDLADVLPLIC